MSWPVKKFSTLISPAGVFTDGDWVESKDQDQNGEVRLIQLADVGVNEFVDKSSRFMTHEAADRLRCTFLEPGDILIARMPDPIGRACIFPGDSKPCVTVVDVCIVRPCSDEIDCHWLVHLINSIKFQQQILKHVTGTTRQRISRGNLAQLEVDVPPLAEQKRIAAILDKADALRRKRQQAIELADQFLRSVFLDMFGDPVTNPKGWEIHNIHDACLEIVDCVNRTAPVVDYETPYKMIRTTNVRNYEIDLSGVRYVEKESYLNWTRRLLPKKGDIIFTREAPAGEAGIIETDDKVFLGQRTMHFRPDNSKVTSEFMLYELMGEGIKQQINRMSTGSTVKHLSVPECKKFSIRMPPIELQERFSEIVSKIKSLRSKCLNSRIDIEECFNSISRDAFSG